MRTAFLKVAVAPEGYLQGSPSSLHPRDCEASGLEGRRLKRNEKPSNHLGPYCQTTFQLTSHLQCPLVARMDIVSRIPDFVPNVGSKFWSRRTPYYRVWKVPGGHPIFPKRIRRSCNPSLFYIRGLILLVYVPYSQARALPLLGHKPSPSGSDSFLV